MNKRLFIIAAIIISTAVVYADNSTVLVYHNNDKVDYFFAEEIDSIRYSGVGSPNIQEICTPDSIYQYKVNDVDSIVFKSNIVKPKLTSIDLAGEIYPYVIGSDYSNGITLSIAKDTPSNLLPKNDMGVYCLYPCDKLPAGFEGIIIETRESDDAIVYECRDAALDELFDELVWTSNAESEVPAGLPRRVALGTLVAEPEYPELIEGALIMTDELRDIPAGPETPMIKSKISVAPSVIYQTGAYVIPMSDGRTSQMRRIRTDVNSKVSGKIYGRYNVGSKKITTGLNSSFTQTVNLGLGQSYTVTFKGTLATKGKMGVDYSFDDAEYKSSVVVTIEFDNTEWVSGKSDITHECTQMPTRTLDASMSGEATLTGSLTLTTTQSGDSLKTVSSTFAYGSKLVGDALFLTSEIEGGATDNTLYKRITNTGVTASSIEKVSASAKYQSNTLKMTDSIEVEPSEVFYVVPKFSKPIYQNGKMTWNVIGSPMNFSSASLGIAYDRSGTYTFTQSGKVWPSDCRQEYSVSVNYDSTRDTGIYPTVTMPSGERILAAPKYPYVGNILFPIISTQTKGNVTVTSGIPIIGSAANGVSSVNIGNLFPFKVSEDKDNDKK